MKKQQEKQTEKTVNTCAKYTDLLPINYCSNIESVISIILLLSIKLSPSSKVPKNRTNQKKIGAKIQLVQNRLKEKYKIPRKPRMQVGIASKPLELALESRKPTAKMATLVDNDSMINTYLFLSQYIVLDRDLLTTFFVQLF